MRSKRPHHLNAPPDNADNAFFSLCTLMVKNLENEVERLKTAEEDRRQRVCLGQAAYVMDDLARDFVFRGQPQLALLSVGEIRNRAERGELAPLQLERWKDFARFLQAKEWSVSDVVAVAKPLRAGRYVDAHGLLQKVTQQQLEDWAYRHLQPAQVEGVRSFIRLLAAFAVDGRVLCNACHAVPVVQACLNLLNTSRNDPASVPPSVPPSRVLQHKCTAVSHMEYNASALHTNPPATDNMTETYRKLTNPGNTPCVGESCHSTGT
eukprot:gene17712-24071_t